MREESRSNSLIVTLNKLLTALLHYLRGIRGREEYLECVNGAKALPALWPLNGLEGSIKYSSVRKASFISLEYPFWEGTSDELFLSARKNLSALLLAENRQKII